MEAIEAGEILNPFYQSIKKNPLFDHVVEPGTPDDGDEIITTMHIIGSAGVKYLGGVLGQIGEVTSLYLPLVLMEAPHQGGFSLGLRPLFLSYGLMDIVNVRTDFVYVLQKGNKKDQQLTVVYENTINAFKAQEAGIVSPTTEQIVDINRR